MLFQLPWIDEEQEGALGSVGYQQVDSLPGDGVSQVLDGLNAQGNLGATAGCIGSAQGCHGRTSTLLQDARIADTLIGSHVVHMQSEACDAHG